MEPNQLPPKQFCVPFIVDEKAFALWDDDVPDKNLAFINQIDPEYFNYVSHVNFSVLQSNPAQDQQEVNKTRQHAAIAMRIAYSQGLETLFSFIFASLQAPDCVIGWLLKYSNLDLINLLKKLNNYEPIRTRTGDAIYGWEGVTKEIFRFLTEEQKSEIKSTTTGFANLWSKFAFDYLKEDFSSEYNSIKHGLRVLMGGIQVWMGLETTPGVPCPPEKMSPVAASEFGTTFFTPEKIDKVNYVVHRHSKNWHPENYYHALQLISLSIDNLITYLKKSNLEGGQIAYLIPNDDEFENKPWNLPSQFSVKHSSPIRRDVIPLLTGQDVINSYPIRA